MRKTYDYPESLKLAVYTRSRRNLISPGRDCKTSAFFNRRIVIFNSLLRKIHTLRESIITVESISFTAAVFVPVL